MRRDAFVLTAAIAVASVLCAPPAAAAALRPGDLLVADETAGGSGAIILINPETERQEIVSEGGLFSHPEDLVLTPRGQIYVADLDGTSDGLGGVIRVDPTTGAQTEVANGGFFEDPSGIAREASGHMVVSDRAGETVVRVDLITGEQREVSGGANLVFPDGVMVDPLSGTIWVADPAATTNSMGALIRIDPLTGGQAVVADNPDPPDPIGLTEPSDVAIERSSGELLLIDPDADSEPMGSDAVGSLFRVDPATGETTRITTAGLFDGPSGIAVGNAGAVLVANRSGIPPEFVPAVIGVNPRTGAQHLIAREGELESPADVIMVPERCKGRFATIQGTNRRDVLKGTAFADVIVTYRGRDLVNAGGGDDIVCGGAGSDTLGGAKGRDSLFGQTGNDSLFGGTGKDRLFGGPGGDLRRP